MIQSSSRFRRKAGYLCRLFDLGLLFVLCITNTYANNATYATYATCATCANNDIYANNGIYANSATYAICANNAFYTTKPFRPRLWGLVLLGSAQLAPQ
jgi:hypothetical protein